MLGGDARGNVVEMQRRWPSIKGLDPVGRPGLWASLLTRSGWSLCGQTLQPLQSASYGNYRPEKVSSRTCKPGPLTTKYHDPLLCCYAHNRHAYMRPTSSWLRIMYMVNTGLSPWLWWHIQACHKALHNLMVLGKALCSISHAVHHQDAISSNYLAQSQFITWYNHAAWKQAALQHDLDQLQIFLDYFHHPNTLYM